MDEKKKGTEAAGKNRAVNFFALRLAVAAYLAWLGFDLLRTWLAGASGLSPAVAWGCGAGFLAAGLGFGIYSLLRFRRETARERKEAEQTDKTPPEQ